MEDYESLLDKYQLCKDKFELVIGVGMSRKQVLTIFRVTEKEMNDWCMAEYGFNFGVIYDVLRQMAYSDFLDVVKILGLRGNPSALNILNQSLNSLAATQTVKIVFGNDVPTESEEDSEND